MSANKIIDGLKDAAAGRIAKSRTYRVSRRAALKVVSGTPSAPSVSLYRAPLARVARSLAKLTCRLRGHDFLGFNDHTKRKCTRCAREEWLFRHLHDRTDRPNLEWKHMDWEGLERRLRLTRRERKALRLTGDLLG